MVAVPIRRLVGEALTRRTDVHVLFRDVGVPCLAEHPLFPAEAPTGDDGEYAAFGQRLRDLGRVIPGIERDRLEREAGLSTLN